MNIEKIKEKIDYSLYTKDDWDRISCKTLPEEILDEYKDYINWNLYTFENHEIFAKNLKLIKKYKEYINWEYLYSSENSLCNKKILTPKFLEKYKKYLTKICWDTIFMQKRLTIKFIYQFKQFIDFHWIANHCKLSKNLIREFKNEFTVDDWNNLVLHIHFPESFIREFLKEFTNNYTHFTELLIYQKLSKKFITEFKDKFNSLDYDILKDDFCDY